MATPTPSSALVPVAPVFTNTERLALAGFLAGYSGLTRQAYELDLRQFVGWCQQHQLRLFQARRADIECSARDLEARRHPGQHHAAAVHRRRVPALAAAKQAGQPGPVVGMAGQRKSAMPSPLWWSMPYL